MPGTVSPDDITSSKLASKCFIMKFKERTEQKRLLKVMFELALMVVASKFDDTRCRVQVYA